MLDTNNMTNHFTRILFMEDSHICWSHALFSSRQMEGPNFYISEKETATHVFLCEYCTIFQNTFFCRTPPGDCFWAKWFVGWYSHQQFYLHIKRDLHVNSQIAVRAQGSRVAIFGGSKLVSRKYEKLWVDGRKYEKPTRRSCSELFQTVCSYHVTYAYQSEPTLYSYMNVKELLARNRRNIWSLSDCKVTPTHNHLIRKRTLNHLVKLAKWLSCVVSTYLYGAFDCMFLSCHRTDKHSQHSWVIWPIWLNSWVFVYE